MPKCSLESLSEGSCRQPVLPPRSTVTVQNLLLVGTCRTLKVISTYCDKKSYLLKTMTWKHNPILYNTCLYAKFIYFCQFVVLIYYITKVTRLVFAAPKILHLRKVCGFFTRTSFNLHDIQLLTWRQTINQTYKMGSVVKKCDCRSQNETKISG